VILVVILAMKLTQYADWAHLIISGKKTKVNHSDESFIHTRKKI